MSTVTQAAITCTTTFGREEELATIKERIDRLDEGRGATVLLSGEAGIGKTRLVAEARARATQHSVQVLHGSAFELDRALPYGPIADLFRTFLSTVAVTVSSRKSGATSPRLT